MRVMRARRPYEVDVGDSQGLKRLCPETSMSSLHKEREEENHKKMMSLEENKSCTLRDV